MPTERFDLTADAWADLGPTPCFLQLGSPTCAVLFVIDATAPADLDAPAHVLAGSGEDGCCDIGLTAQRLFARALAPQRGAAVVVSR